MNKMDNNMREDADGAEPEIIRAEVVEITPGAPWEWQDVEPVRPRRRRWRLPLILFLITCVTTYYAGEGLAYALPLMTILVCHEMGHFLQAYRYGIHASFPFFIPMPPGISPFGTMGAVIAMEPRVGGRRALFDVGITGPLAGLVPTFIFMIVGLHYSNFVPISGHGITFGTPLIFDFFANWILDPAPQGMGIKPHPMAFAGWVGLFITSLNLIPIGQLDGGHVLYALLRRKAHKVAKFLLFAALFIVILNWEQLSMWALMIVLLFLMGPVHPPTANDHEPLGWGRTVLGWLTLAFILVGFTPVPISFPGYH